MLTLTYMNFENNGDQYQYGSVTHLYFLFLFLFILLTKSESNDGRVIFFFKR